MIMGHGGSIEWFYKANLRYSHVNTSWLSSTTGGAGRSDKPDIPYTTEMMAHDLDGILDAISAKIGTCSGGSMGGMIAQQFVLHPKRVRSLILACTYCGGTQGSLGMALDPEVISPMKQWIL